MKILRVLSRIYLGKEQLDASVAFYETLFGEPSRLRFTYPEADLELAGVGPFLLIAGSEAALRPFRATSATFLVDSLNEWKSFLLKNGATILREPQQVPTGLNMLVEHLDGTQIEYVQHSEEQIAQVRR